MFDVHLIIIKVALCQPKKSRFAFNYGFQQKNWLLFLTFKDLYLCLVGQKSWIDNAKTFWCDLLTKLSKTSFNGLIITIRLFMLIYFHKKIFTCSKTLTSCELCIWKYLIPFRFLKTKFQSTSSWMNLCM
jgi:hypothetical protein